MARGPGKLRGTIESDGDHVWNGFGTIKDSAGNLESQRGDRRSIARTVYTGLAMDSQVFSLVISIAQSTG